jgi:hypothetical protein
MMIDVDRSVMDIGRSSVVVVVVVGGGGRK